MYAPDTEADFAALAAKLSGERAAKVLSCGNTPAGRRGLAAGLLLYAVLGKNCAWETGAYGKPALADGRQFNLSHAGDYAVLATADDSIGVDVEIIRPVDCLRIAKRFFHPDELAYLQAQSEPEAAFFALWTLKESYGKALGRGFFVGPARYCILPDGQQSAKLKTESPYAFRCYHGVLPGYCLSVCSADHRFPDTVTPVYIADAR